MIQTYHVQAPCDAPAATVQGVLTDAVEHITRRHPALRGAHFSVDAGVLEIAVRVQGLDRWKCQRAAVTIASALLRKVKIDANLGKVVAVHTTPSARSLTREQGRNVANVYAPARKREQQRRG